jgi:hypothetical protein
MVSVRALVATGSVVAFGMVFSGWGGSAAAAGQPVSSASLAPYLVRAGEETGYSPTRPSFYRSAAAWAASTNSPADASRYRREGFRGALSEGTNGAHGDQGVSYVEVLGSPAAAKSEAQGLLKQSTTGLPGGVTATSFTVRQLPTSEGDTQTSSARVANVWWVEGSCLLVVGDYTSYYPTERSAVIAGALKVYARTAHSAGVC